MFFGHVEPDKWPLALARLRGQAQAVPGVRRGRKSFDGFRQIAKLTSFPLLELHRRKRVFPHANFIFVLQMVAGVPFCV